MAQGPFEEVYLCAGLRTPVGRFGGALASVRPDDLLAHTFEAVLERTGIEPGAIEDVIAGCANQAGEDNRDVARMAGLLAGLPDSVPGVTVNRLCASSLEAVHMAARRVWCGESELLLVGGVESMSRAPFAVPRNATGKPARGHFTTWDTALGWRFPNPRMEAMFPLESMGETAENVAEQREVSREAQDRFAMESHRRAVEAQRDGTLSREIVPVEVPRRKGDPLEVDADEGPRPDSTMDKLQKLKPAFREGGTVTAGNSSALNDGAAALVVCSGRAAERHGLEPMARLVAPGTAGVDPTVMGLGPVPATRNAAERAGWSLDEVELVELNEAFAAQSLAVMEELGLDHERVNVRGGAIALGHPLGMSGARILISLLHAMRDHDARRGLATLCVGVGQGVASLVERP